MKVKRVCYFDESFVHTGVDYKIFPVDNYEHKSSSSKESSPYKIPEELIIASNDYHILYVPILGQYNNLTKLTSEMPTSYCGRASCAMVYNFRILATNPDDAKDKYIIHWGKKEKGKWPWVPEIRHQDTGILGAADKNPDIAKDKYHLRDGFNNITTHGEKMHGKKTIKIGYKINSLFEKERLRLRDTIDNANLKNDGIKKLSKDFVNKVFKPITDSLLCNNPVIIYTAMGGSMKSCHVIVFSGFFYFDGELWLLIAEPSVERGRNYLGSDYPNLYENDKIKPDSGYLNNNNAIVIYPGNWKNGIGGLWLIKARHLFSLHPKSSKYTLLDYSYSQSTPWFGATRDFFCGRILYNDKDYFEVPKELVNSSMFSRVVYPLQKYGIILDRPLYQFYEAEKAEGGYYPTGYNQTVHGGVHFNPDTDKEGFDYPVRCMADGYIVAARLNSGMTALNEEYNKYLYKYLGNYTGFVLIRHDIVPLDDAGKPKPGEKYPLYSLYMHLRPSAAKEKNELDKALQKVKWLKRFHHMRNNMVVSLNAKLENFFGQISWAKTRLEGSNWDSVSVYNNDEIIYRTYTSMNKKFDTAFAAETNKDFAQAYEGFMKGSVVTFDKPFITVRAGEIIGYVRTVRNESKGFLHWEIFAPKKEKSIENIIKLYDEKGKKFFSFEENKEDNFLEKPELDKLFKNLPDNCTGNKDFYKQNELDKKNEKIKELKDDNKKSLPTDKNPSLQALLVQRYRLWLEQYFQCTDTGGFDKKEYFTTFPVKIKITSGFDEFDDEVLEEIKIFLKFYKYRGLDSKETSIGEKIIYLTSGMVEEFKTGKIIQVPIDTSFMVVTSDDCNIKYIENFEKEKELFDSMIKYRLRNIYLDHLQEWSGNSLKKTLKTLLSKSYLTNTYKENGREKKDVNNTKTIERYEKYLTPLTWWARKKTAKDAYGELAVVGKEGEEKSIFNKEMLPENGRIQNIHPVTFLWLLRLLTKDKQEKLAILSDHQMRISEQENKAAYYGLFYDTSKELSMGDLFYVAVIGEHRTTKTSNLYFLYHTKTKTKILEGKVFYNEYGVFYKSFEVDFWGRIQLQLENCIKKPSAYNKNNIEFDIAKPEINYKSSTHYRDYSESIRFLLYFKNKCPTVLSGYVCFYYNKYSKESNTGWTPLKKAIPIKGREVKRKKRTSYILFSLNPEKAYETIKEVTGELKKDESIKLAYVFIATSTGLNNQQNSEYDNSEIVDADIGSLKERDYIHYPEEKIKKHVVLNHKIVPLKFTSKINIYTRTQYNDVIIYAEVRFSPGLRKHKPYFEKNKVIKSYLDKQRNTILVGYAKMSEIIKADIKELNFKTQIESDAHLVSANVVEESYKCEPEFGDFTVDIFFIKKKRYIRVNGTPFGIPTKYALQLSWKPPHLRDTEYEMIVSGIKRKKNGSFSRELNGISLKTKFHTYLSEKEREYINSEDKDLLPGIKLDFKLHRPLEISKKGVEEESKKTIKIFDTCIIKDNTIEFHYSFNYAKGVITYVGKDGRKKT